MLSTALQWTRVRRGTAGRQLPAARSSKAFPRATSTGSCAAARFGSTASGWSRTRGWCWATILRIPPIRVAAPDAPPAKRIAPADRPADPVRRRRPDRDRQARGPGRPRRQRHRVRRHRATARRPSERQVSGTGASAGPGYVRATCWSQRNGRRWSPCTQRCATGRSTSATWSWSAASGAMPSGRSTCR